MARPYREVRKDYINVRQDAILRSFNGRANRRAAKEAACLEFDEFVQDQRRIAVNEALERAPLVTEQAPETEGFTP
jgi:hypothetical protein